MKITFQLAVLVAYQWWLHLPRSHATCVFSCVLTEMPFMNIYHKFSVNEIKAFRSVHSDTCQWFGTVHISYTASFKILATPPFFQRSISPPPRATLRPPQHEVTSQFPRTGCSANSLWEPRCPCHGPNSGRCQPLSRSPCRPTSACITTHNRTVLSSSLRNVAYCVEKNTIVLANSGKDHCWLSNTVLMKLCICPHLVSFIILSVWSWEKVMLAKKTF